MPVRRQATTAQCVSRRPAVDIVPSGAHKLRSMGRRCDTLTWFDARFFAERRQRTCHYLPVAGARESSSGLRTTQVDCRRRKCSRPTVQRQASTGDYAASEYAGLPVEYAVRYHVVPQRIPAPSHLPITPRCWGHGVSRRLTSVLRSGSGRAIAGLGLRGGRHRSPCWPIRGGWPATGIPATTAASEVQENAFRRESDTRSLSDGQ